MPSFNLLVDAVALAMDVSRSQATAANLNIASANVSGGRLHRADFARAQGLLIGMSHGELAMDGAVRQLRAAGIDMRDAGEAQGDVNLDDEVARMVEASGRYQALTDTLSRHFSLMSLALSGDQA